MINTITVIKSLLTLFLGLICVGGDKLVNINKDSLILRAISDNITHGIIGLVSFAIVTIQYRTVITWIEQILLLTGSFTISCVIDVDHFIMARSWKLLHATNLSSRPFLHCSTIPLVLIGATYLLSTSKYGTNSIRVLLWLMMVVVAFASHHIRDATRRGLWFLGYGHTPPLPYWFYVTLIMVMPWIVVKIVEHLAVIRNLMTYNRVVDV